MKDKYFAVPNPVWVCTADDKKCQTRNSTDANTCSSCGSERAKGYWNFLRVDVMRRNEDGSEEKVGEYERNYGSFYSTFCPFKQDDREYALISHTYTGTCVIELPSCKHVAGACEWENAGFCPTGFYVPEPSTDEEIEKDDRDEDDDRYPDAEYRKNMNGQFGFVCGCVWGDDSGGWKLEFVDLSRLSEGKFTQSAKFGYLELPSNISGSELHKAIRIRGSHQGEQFIEIRRDQDFSFRLETDPLFEKTREGVITKYAERMKRLFSLDDAEDKPEIIRRWLRAFAEEIQDVEP